MSIQFTVSGDTHLLAQYYALRERCFRRELGLAGFDGSEEEQDRLGVVLLALKDGKCVGGARISDHVSLPSHLAALNINQDACCMWERFVVDPHVRTVQLVRDFCANMVEASRDHGYRHAMVLSSLCNARLYRRLHTSLGVAFEIHRHVPHCAKGSFAGLEHYLSVAYLRDQQPLRLAV